ncbi:polysaccharide deacetylase family protein [Flavobacterium granuli]|uniref:Peptidoglycan/xylan/chitin deacetylase (PgdA/CDA1 family) n=1 Tax=Flavobacterium granuli TaxID=280093 RepID=A0A1M5NKW2_9FLAO|nr:polysaccharide deacetylase family protein [Flavobacterium granuli]PRZ23317.1 peptidoglycan/xylan/chitin deacetylase (PgdA/CDA1 family) [Flavobacterium granuli]SHG90097.1 Peptidoglycan/xylan/chitin deacetylase, PgdA/CDA1 family [Flavobacterium granuli]
MKRSCLKIVVIVSVIALGSYETKLSKPKQNKAGVVISFDDAYIDEWFEADRLLKKYDWKATFCVCRIDSIGAPQIKKLQQLQNKGHEIAGHGYHHYNAIKFLKTNTMDAYMKQEIDPMRTSMKRWGFNVTSFAYPYGERSDALDKALAPKFKIIRGRAFCDEIPEKEGCYFRNSKKVYAFDIDNNHIHFSTPYLLQLLDYAKKKNKILILCGHKPVQNLTGNYQVKMETLEWICKYIQRNDMKFYTLSDLDKLKNTH